MGLESWNIVQVRKTIGGGNRACRGHKKICPSPGSYPMNIYWVLCSFYSFQIANRHIPRQSPVIGFVFILSRLFGCRIPSVSLFSLQILISVPDFLSLSLHPFPPWKVEMRLGEGAAERKIKYWWHICLWPWRVHSLLRKKDGENPPGYILQWKSSESAMGSTRIVQSEEFRKGSWVVFWRRYLWTKS